MELWEGGYISRVYEIVLGGNPYEDKVRQGDERTPEGKYRVVKKNPNSKYHRFLGINYPNVEDADRGLEERLISQRDWANIFFANIEDRMPPSSTPLGGLIGIHGFGGRPLIKTDWTEGCIAVSDSEIEELYYLVDHGTKVVIEP